MNIYIGNLSREVTEEDLNQLFGTYGALKSAKVIRDMFTQDSKGFGFVEMQSKSDGEKAINELNGKELKGKRIVVNEARPKSDKKRVGQNRRSHSGGRRY
jgi:RNA recognition motif-containing protein